MEIQFGQSLIRDIGKLIKESKREHIFIVFLNSVRYRVVIYESIYSKRLRLCISGNLVFNIKATEEDKLKGFDLEHQGFTLKIQKAPKSKVINLFINGQQFHPGLIKSRTKESGVEDSEPKTTELEEGNFDQEIPLNLGSDSEEGSLNFDNFQAEGIKAQALYAKFD